MADPVVSRRNDPVSTSNMVLGFVENAAAAAELATEVKRQQLATSGMKLFDGPAGLEALEEMLRGSWGEAEQAFFERAQPELENGHVAVAFSVENLESAAQIGKLAGDQGGRNFTHFGTFVDTGLET